MKAFTFAFLLTVSAAGTACSQQSEAQDETAASDPGSETAATETSSQFNLRYPTDGVSRNTTAGSSGQFNLRAPGDVTSAPRGPTIPDAALQDNALRQVPEVEQPALAPDSGTAAEPAETPDTSDDGIIRLEDD